MVARRFRTALLIAMSACLVVLGTTAASPGADAASKIAPRVLRETLSDDAWALRRGDGSRWEILHGANPIE